MSTVLTPCQLLENLWVSSFTFAKESIGARYTIRMADSKKSGSVVVQDPRANGFHPLLVGSDMEQLHWKAL